MPVPATARPVIPRRLHKDAVFDHLLAAVFDGTLSPGERLRDVDLERWLGVSRTPIRVALAKLGDLRLVETTSKRATRVVVPCAAEAADLFATACAMVAAEADGLVAASDDPDRARLAAGLRAVASSGAGAEGAGAAGRLAELVGPMADALDRGLSGGLAAERLRLVGLPLRHHLRALPPGLPTGLARALDLAAAAVERGDAPGVVEAARLAAAAAVASFPTSAPGARGVVGPGREPGVVGATEVTAASFRAPRLLSDDVHDALLKVVLDGTLGPGERLVDDELIAWLGVSRTPIRAALERLSDVGVVELAANRYTRVARPDRASFEEARRLCSGLLAWSALRVDPSASAVGPLDRSVSVALAPRDVALPDGSEPITLAAFSWLMRQARRVALVPQVGALAHEVDRLEPRLAHAVVARRGRLRPGAWQAFERAAGVAGGPDGRRRAEAVRGLLASIDIEAVEPQ
jgi:DNA-binding GntR family transcriptional regulator